jgi:hypothetical protein
MSQSNGGGQPLKWQSPQELESKIQEYYNWAKENGKHITVSGLAWFLGCDRQTLLNYENADENDWLKRVDEETKRKYIGTIKEAKRRIEMEYEESLYNRSKATGAIFTLKNNYNWKDKQEIVNTNKEIIVDIIEDEE